MTTEKQNDDSSAPVERDVRPTVFVCCACGKRSYDLYGNNPIDRGWDESCGLNCVEAFEDALMFAGGRVVKINDGGIVPPNAELSRASTDLNETADGKASA